MHFGHSLFPHLTKTANLNRQNLILKQLTYLNIGIPRVQHPTSAICDEVRIGAGFLFFVFSLVVGVEVMAIGFGGIQGRKLIHTWIHILLLLWRKHLSVQTVFPLK